MIATTTHEGRRLRIKYMVCVHSDISSRDLENKTLLEVDHRAPRTYSAHEWREPAAGRPSRLAPGTRLLRSRSQPARPQCEKQVPSVPLTMLFSSLATPRSHVRPPSSERCRDASATMTHVAPRLVASRGPSRRTTWPTARASGLWPPGRGVQRKRCAAATNEPDAHGAAVGVQSDLATSLALQPHRTAMLLHMIGRCVGLAGRQRRA